MPLPHSLYGLRVILILSAYVYTNMNCAELVYVVSSWLRVGSGQQIVLGEWGWFWVVADGFRSCRVVSHGFGWFWVICCFSSYGLRNGLMKYPWVAFLNRCCHYLFFYESSQWILKFKLTCKRACFMESKIRFDYIYISCNFCWPIFLLWSIFIPPVDIQLKWRNRLCWAYPRLIFFRVNWFEKTIN